MCRKASDVMKSGSELDVKQGIQQTLETLSRGRFICTDRKALRGKSAIGKPVDLQISFADDLSKAAIAVEVANVNTTQLVGETCRLHYDCCPLKLMILGDRNVPKDGKKQCEQLFAKLYGQDDIRNTPARVAMFDEDELIEAALRDLLLVEKSE
jgi:hypothetical protein